MKMLYGHYGTMLFENNGFIEMKESTDVAPPDAEKLEQCLVGNS